MDQFQINNKFEKDYTVSDAIYSGFIELFKDNNPLHTETQFALSKNFKGEVMHGNILNGFLSHFIGVCLPIKNVIIHSQDIQYKNPVYKNETLHFEAVVSEIFESVNTIIFKFQFKNSESKIVAKGKIQIGII